MRKIVFIISIAFVSVMAKGQQSEADTLRVDTMALQEIFSALPSSGEATKAAGDSAYLQNDYLAAIQIYESLLRQGEAAEVYYNLGNSYYKSGNLARAILNYERALLLEPGNDDARVNLEIARAKTVDKVMPVPEVFFITWFKALVGTLAADVWGRLGIGCFVLFLAGLCLFFYSKLVWMKKGGFIGALVMLVLTVLCNLFALQQMRELTRHDKAIVLLPSVTVRSTPSESGTSLFILHEGHKVEVEDNSMREWKEIRLEDGKVGWLPASSIEAI